MLRLFGRLNASSRRTGWFSLYIDFNVTGGFFGPTKKFFVLSFANIQIRLDTANRMRMITTSEVTALVSLGVKSYSFGLQSYTQNKRAQTK